MIVVTGSAGFIASVVAKRLNEAGRSDLVLVDDFNRPDKEKNFSSIQYKFLVQRDRFFSWFDEHADEITFVIHLGARTDTTEFDVNIFNELNLGYTQEIWNLCSYYQIPLVYASSAATYGDGELGYDDNHDIIEKLQPLNPYGHSKNDFDIWALKQSKVPPFWAGLKFFNVYGPNEYHKGRMASVILHAFRQIQENGKVRLFRSHRPDYRDGEQLRDFVYVKDVAEVILFLMEQSAPSGLYNLGTGKARTFLDLTRATFSALDIEPVIEFIDTPADIRDKYQYFTEANMNKLIEVGYQRSFTSLEDGVQNYVREYLVKESYY
ncbi:MAG: ADP-glyceromanno-heptose 6-epimerase [Bacteroidales bacterium]|nr:ADP-glyceromanno-heptose 6-epimerase [Bacteroidales bacterium]